MNLILPVSKFKWIVATDATAKLDMSIIMADTLIVLDIITFYRPSKLVDCLTYMPSWNSTVDLKLIGHCFKLWYFVQIRLNLAILHSTYIFNA